MSDRDIEIFKKFELLETKFWYRLLKVFFIAITLGVFLLGSVLLWDNKPYKIIDNEKSYIQCDRDKEAELIYLLGKNGWDQYGRIYDEQPTLDYYDDQSVRKVCNAPLNKMTGKPIPAFSSFIPDDINYKYYPILKTEGSNWEFIRAYLMFYFFFFLGFKLIKEAFFYIATGKRMFAHIQSYNQGSES